MDLLQVTVPLTHADTESNREFSTLTVNGNAQKNWTFALLIHIGFLNPESEINLTHKDEITVCTC